MKNNLLPDGSAILSTRTFHPCTTYTASGDINGYSFQSEPQKGFGQHSKN